jgi:hypothetical protein
MATNTNFNPKTMAEFTKDHLEFYGQSIFLEAIIGATTEQDLLVADDMLLTGGELLVEDGNMGDLIYLQVYHPTFGVVKEFVSGYHVAPDSIRQTVLNIQYPSKLFAGLSIRCKYVAANSGVVRRVAVNLFLHKILE